MLSLLLSNTGIVSIDLESILGIYSLIKLMEILL